MQSSTKCQCLLQYTSNAFQFIAESLWIQSTTYYFDLPNQSKDQNDRHLVRNLAVIFFVMRVWNRVTLNAMGVLMAAPLAMDVRAWHGIRLPGMGVPT